MFPQASRAGRLYVGLIDILFFGTDSMKKALFPQTMILGRLDFVELGV